MTIIQKTISIPDSHKVSLELSLPDSIPAGIADITVTIAPKAKKHPRVPLKSLAGALATSEHFPGDSVAIVRQWRDEEW